MWLGIPKPMILYPLLWEGAVRTVGSHLGRMPNCSEVPDNPPPPQEPPSPVPLPEPPPSQASPSPRGLRPTVSWGVSWRPKPGLARAPSNPPPPAGSLCNGSDGDPGRSAPPLRAQPCAPPCAPRVPTPVRPQGCIGKAGHPPPLQGAQPMPSHCPPNAKCQPQWHL